MRAQRYVYGLLLVLLISAAALSPVIGAENKQQQETLQLSISLEELRKLLQQSLTIHEIDQEVARLSDNEKELAKQITVVQQKIEMQDELVNQTRERAGKVLRSYYMGERDNLWLLIFNANSLMDAFVIYDYLTMIFQNDRQSLDQYIGSYRELQQLHGSLLETQSELAKIKSDFLAQRERLVQLQEQLDRELASLPDVDLVLEQMNQLTLEWETKGLPVFRQYLQAMSDAMVRLPDYLAQNNNSLTSDGTYFIFTIVEEPLNDFLRDKNELFQYYSYRIDREHINIEGQRDDVEMIIKGHYEIENQPENTLRFIIDELVYNGYSLPDTTKNNLQDQFSMSFQPKKATGFLSAFSVELGDGEIVIRLVAD